MQSKSEMGSSWETTLALARTKRAIKISTALIKNIPAFEKRTIQRHSPQATLTTADAVISNVYFVTFDLI